MPTSPPSRLRVSSDAAPSPTENESKKRLRWTSAPPRSIARSPTSQPTVTLAAITATLRASAPGPAASPNDLPWSFAVPVGSMPIATSRACRDASTPFATSANVPSPPM